MAADLASNDVLGLVRLEVVETLSNNCLIDFPYCHGIASLPHNLGDCFHNRQTLTWHASGGRRLNSRQQRSSIRRLLGSIGYLHD